MYSSTLVQIFFPNVSDEGCAAAPGASGTIELYPDKEVVDTI